MKELGRLILPIIGGFGAIRYIILGVISGLCSFFFISQTTMVIGLLLENELKPVKTEYMIIFSFIILSFAWTKRALSITSMEISLNISWTLRTRILRKVLNSNYHQISKRVTDIQTAILTDVGVLTSASLSVIDFSIAVIVTISCFIYLAIISYFLFLITLLVSLVGVTSYFLSYRANLANIRKSRELENDFQDHLNASIFGFKQLFMDDLKSFFLLNNKIRANAKSSYHYSLKAGTGYINNQMIGQILFYVLIVSVLLVFSESFNIEPKYVVTFIFTLLYLLGSIETIMSKFPILMRAQVSAGRLLELNEDLDHYQRKDDEISKEMAFGKFKGLRIYDLTFSYMAEGGSFHVGPIDFNVDCGDTIFINGANGSGKTTFIFNLLGLLPPDTAKIEMNGCDITDFNHPSYRKYFAVVFSDVHLFGEILKESFIDIKLWKKFVTLFELENKVNIVNNRLSTIDLSKGQQKRLALIIALLEEKPIIVLDEWAADQDPFFRNKFYTKIVPYLNTIGYTIIAITHDDKYYDVCDKLYRMDGGLLVREAKVTVPIKVNNERTKT